jgi:type II secretory pathway component GspD/PulD (secretin)
MNSPRLLLVALTLATSPLFAQQSQQPSLVRVDVEMVAVPFDKGLELLPNLRDPGSIDGAMSQIHKLISTGGATLIGWPELITKSGQRAVTEDIQEVRYAADFASRRTTSKENQVQETKAPQVSGAPVPTEMETRNAGITLEVEPVVGPDGQTIDLNLVPQYVRLTDMPVIASGRDQNGHEWRIEQPRFYTAKTTTSVMLQSGHRMLLAQFRGLDGSNQILFFILKAEVVPAPAAAPKP